MSRRAAGRHLGVWLGAAALVATLAPFAWSQPPQLSRVERNYLERCGGCHGLKGISAPEEVPSLRGQAGHFLCTQEGRAYVVRLPNVALAALSDIELAELMNYVTRDMGRAGASDAAAPYTAAEVHGLRAQPLRDGGLLAYRKAVIDRMKADCGAPDSLYAYSVHLP